MAPIRHIACFLLIGITADAAQKQWDGYDLFFAALKDRGIKLSRSPYEPLVFVIGTAPKRPPASVFKKAVKEGATLVLATEAPQAQALFNTFGMQLEEDVVFSLPTECFRGQLDCPRITNLQHHSNSALLKNVNALAVNRAKALTGKGAPLAWFPAFFTRPKVFMKKAAYGKGSIIAIGDQSIFINLMLPEEDNRRFLLNLLDQTGGGTATVFINGTIYLSDRLTSEQPDTMPQIPNFFPDIQPTVAELNALLSDIQNEINFQQAGRTLLPFLLVAAALILLLVTTHTILHYYFPRARFRGKKKRTAETSALTVRYLTNLLPPEERRQLLRSAKKSHRKRGFSRFINELEAHCNEQQNK